MDTFEKIYNHIQNWTNSLTQGDCKQYQQTKPFPHMAWKNWLPHDVAMEIWQEYLDSDPASWRIDNYYSPMDGEHVQMREQYHPADDLGIKTKQLLAVLQSNMFLKFAEKLLGIPGLVVDPSLMCSGYVDVRSPSGFKQHLDFNWQSKLNLMRVGNILLYLTPDWKEEWGGQLQAYDIDNDTYSDIPNDFNTCAMMTINEKSWHGYPELSSPPEIPRLAFRMWFFISSGNEETAMQDKRRTENHLHPSLLLPDVRGGEQFDQSGWNKSSIDDVKREKVDSTSEGGKTVFNIHKLK